MPAPGRGASSSLPSLWSPSISGAGGARGPCGPLLAQPSWANVSLTLTGGVSTCLRHQHALHLQSRPAPRVQGPAAAWQAQKGLLVSTCYSWSRSPSGRSGCWQTRPRPLRRHLDPILGPRFVPFILALLKNTFLFVSAESLSASSGSPRHTPGAGRSPVPSAWLPQASSCQMAGSEALAAAWLWLLGLCVPPS